MLSYNIGTSKTSITNFGLTLVKPIYVFTEDEKNKEIIIIDANEFREVVFRVEGDTVNRYVFSQSLQNIYPENCGRFIPYFNHKAGFLYTIFPDINSYSVIRYKKKKFSNPLKGIISGLVHDINGIIGTAKPNIGHEIYAHNSKGINIIKIKKGLQPINNQNKAKEVGKSELKKEIKKEAKKEQKKEEKKKKKKNKMIQQSPLHQSALAYKPVSESGTQLKNVKLSQSEPLLLNDAASDERLVQAPKIKNLEGISLPSESLSTVKSIIKKEVEDGINNVIIPMIESQMNYFEEEFKEMVKREVSILKQNVEQETAKVQYTTRIFKDIVEKTIETNGKFEESIEKQMKELTNLVTKNTSDQTTNVPPNLEYRPMPNEFTVPNTNPRPVSNYMDQSNSYIPPTFPTPNVYIDPRNGYAPRGYGQSNFVRPPYSIDSIYTQHK